LQLQNDSALGVEVNPEAYLCTLLRNLKNIGMFNFGGDILINT